MVSLASIRLLPGAGAPGAGHSMARRRQPRRYPVDPDVPRAAARVTLGPGPLWPGEPEHPRRRLRKHGGSSWEAAWLRAECLTVACGYVGVASMEAPGRHQSGTWSMARGQLGFYGSCPAEIRPAAQHVKPESMTLGRTRPGPRSINTDDSGSEEDRAARGPGPGAADPERARSAHSSGWRRYMDTWDGH